MDIISHGLIGKIISFFGASSSKRTKGSAFWAIFFSVLPDFSLIIFYLILGYQNNRPFFFPYNEDWTGATINYPFLSFLYFFQHSIFFALIIILPIVIYFRLPKIAFFAYLLHLVIDIPTHAGEWQIKPFYPLNYAANGLTDAWAWPFRLLFFSWIVLLSAIIILSVFIKKKTHDKSFNSN